MLPKMRPVFSPSTRWFLGCVAFFLATPFLAFPQIMGGTGPRYVPMWRNAAGIALLALSGMGALVSLRWMLRERRHRLKPTD